MSLENNTLTSIKDKLVIYYDKYKKKQSKLEDIYYDYTKIKSYSKIKQIDVIILFWFSVISAFTLHYSLIYLWKDNNEWTNLEHLTLYYLYYKLGYYICDNTSEYLSKIRSEKQKLEKLKEPGATKENPIDLTTPPTTPTTSTPTTPTTPTKPTKPKIKHITAICQTDDLVEEIEI